ncbi:apolipoprotein N-acyltransferase [Leucobacter sp. OLJS4]|uniref:apolipoprotein N-acyltransferase n=1 Tax=unclassified Leucobacter TaxID=2621730 RepID=UPI000C36AA05|nr:MULTISPECIES: apolipoprotein N-acyltransferase [unclassified Leucobacter]PII81390.1 apolipoprotein N-acyltransferase [Leucobacter sp. OLCALW19]PII86058.1 apolipoprotein N-acyltransferase [Leucobacter sp. OLTLW20]PII89954.1 apolipoprotein N-acyltransferase [Leucobacter sp. OLAS13]PII96985.1 apolipoprotein N-acyltransferase [Leucobacter sp. OLDS2]PIJ02319.1 apolipoprotein N-acyltransferase [Leucobacter sp. OLIS6]
MRVLIGAGVAVRLRFWAAIPLAALGGWSLGLTTPQLAWWPMLFIGVPLVLASVWRQRIGVAALAGAAAGAGFWFPVLSWLTLYLGPVPWLGLGVVMAAWYLLMGIAIAAATRGLALLPVHPWLRVAVLAVAAAGLWTLREQLQGSVPYGGFPWGRLAHFVAETPLASLASWLGFSGLSALIALACAVPIAVLFERLGAKRASTEAAGAPEREPVNAGLVSRARVVAIPTAFAVLGTALALALLAVVPVASVERTGSLRVVAVQGNAKAGIFDDRESGDVLRAHLNATQQVVDRLRAEGERVDVIVWPENSAEFNLPRNPLAEVQIAALAREAGAPIVLGSVLQDPDGSYTNSSLVWTGEGDAGVRYDKMHPVPFAEYMPNREFFRALAPDLVDLVQLDYRTGTRSPAIEVPVGETAERIRAGIAICFDIIFDDQAERMVDDGAQVIFAQTNNADFGRTAESAQQLQIARLRAIETGRAVVNISTVGTSAIVAPDGRDLARLEPFTADAMVADVPLMRGETPAIRFGAWICGVWIALGTAGLVAGSALSLRARHRARETV